MTVRVLIVDDQEPFRLAARMVVDATDGFDVVGEAETGESSVEMARELSPDLVLMDVTLPGINGLDATRAILSEPSNPVATMIAPIIRTRKDSGALPASKHRVRCWKRMAQS